MDSWRMTPQVTVNYGLRYDTTFGLFQASGVSQILNPGVQTISGLQLPLPTGVPHDYHKAFAPRLGIAYSPDQIEDLVIRAGIGLYYNDLAQNGWATAFQAVNTPSAFLPCTKPGDPGCLPGAADGGAGVVIDPQLPHSLRACMSAAACSTYGIRTGRSAPTTFTSRVSMATGVMSTLRAPPSSRRCSPKTRPPRWPTCPICPSSKSDNTSSYNAMMLHLQGNVSRRFNLTANYVLSRAKTWGCVLGELWDYVNGVCNPLNPFGPGDYGPSGEDVTSRFTLAGIVYVPGGFQVSTLFQAESGRPITLTTPVDVNGLGDPTNDRAVVNGVQTTLDQFRGTPYIQLDLRVTRPFKVGERWQILPFVEFFNLFNRNNPGANYVTDISALPTPVNNLYNATAFVSDSGVQRAHHQPQAVAGACRSAGRFLWSRNDGGYSVRGAIGNAGDVLSV